ncbi:HNH endonuclease signature motif containing protein [Caballeronia sp. LZ001]|uniref:HNH endonuclease n=2 Tax=Caballeronia TaxID=1827195 RepID=UPI002861AD70|nr:HNH endonuclease signature motif containing protein [Caballeronia sp. LZ001]MDR5802339.1 HNH endonuclease signature motif containing protein [Caballeronia sp. LZ001]
MTTRMRIAARDSFCCAQCGRAWNEHIDHVDHRVPLEAGGSNDDANLQLLCVDCHARKTAAEAAGRFGR